MSRNRSTWGETIALILRDCDAETRGEFMRSLRQWKRNSTSTMVRDGSHPEDRAAAQSRLVKLVALEEHLEHELDSDARRRQSEREMRALNTIGINWPPR